MYCTLSLNSLPKPTLRLSKASSLDSEGSSRVSNATVAEMATSGATITTTTADSVGGTAKLLDLGGIHAGKSLALQWVTEEDSASDIGSRDTVREGVVNDHTALAIARDDDLGARALLECLLDVLGHDLAAVSAQVGVALISCQCRSSYDCRMYSQQLKQRSRHPGR